MIQVLQIGGANPMLMIAMMVGVFAVMILPQFFKGKKEKKFRSSLQKGDKVITFSGIHGKISDINEQDGTVVIETMAGKILFELVAISVEHTNAKYPKQ